VNGASGEEEWRFETDGLVGAPPMMADGTVYVGSGDGNLYAVDTASGEEEWCFQTGYSVGSSPTIAGGTVYVGSGDGNLYAVAASRRE
jgi:outer membrane protein assembly factor BamB